MSKPEFSLPFNLEHAKAGAPYCCRDGHAAHILKWDRNVSDYPLLGVIRKSDDPRTWTETGSVSYSEKHTSQYDSDLVMLPLGFIDGKPVFVGDKITSPDCKGNTTAHHNMNFGEGSTWTWPVPAPVYATFNGSVDMLAIEYNKDNNFVLSLTRVANAALRHAIDAGQVVPASVHDKATRALIRGGWQDLGVQEWKPKIGEKPAYIRDEERDMDVAQAVKTHFMQNLGSDSSSVARFFAYMDLSSIITSVTGAKDAKEGAQ